MKAREEIAKNLTRSLWWRTGVLACGLWCGFWGLGASQIIPQGTTSAWDQETSFLFTRPEFTWGRDPFGRKPGFAANMESEPTYLLSAVLYDGTNSEAVINDIRVRQGDEIGWRIVEEIGPNYVLLSYGSESIIELNLPIPRGAASQIQLEEVKK